MNDCGQVRKILQNKLKLPGCQSIHPVQKFAQRRQVSTGPSTNFVWGHTDGHEAMGKIAIIRPTAPH